MITISGTGMIVLLAIGYLGVNTIVKSTPIIAKKAVKKIKKTLEEKNRNKE